MNNETIADVIAEMRRCADYLPSRQKYVPKLPIRAWRNLADRIEAAHKREHADWNAETEAAKDARNRVACRMRSEFAEKCRNCERALGSAAAMRDALEICLKKMCGYCREAAGRCGYDVPCVDGCEPLKMAMSALSAPARNCDLYRTEEEALKAWDGLDENDAGDWFAFTDWLFASAEGKEASNG